VAVPGVAAVRAALAGPAVAQEKEDVWTTAGKRWFRTEVVLQPFVRPKTFLAGRSPVSGGSLLCVSHLSR